MIFKSIKASNFLSFKNLELNLENQGLLLLNGENLDNPALNNNGAGKSSILESIVYALYGKTLRGLKGDAVIHKKIGKNMKVFLDLVDDDGISYRIARYRKHEVNKNKSLLYKNNKDITPKSEADFDDYVNNLLQADYNTFISSLLYSAESFKFATATDSEIKKTFDTMLGLDVFFKSLEITKQRLRNNSLENGKLTTRLTLKNNDLTKLNQKLEQIKQSSNNYAQDTLHQIETCTQSLVVLREKSEQLKDNLKDLQTAKTIYEEKLQKAEKTLAERKNDIKQLQQLQKELQKIKDEKSKIVSKIQEQQSELKTQNFKIDDAKVKQRALKEKLMELVLKRDNLKDKIGTPCEVCGQPLTESSVEPIRQNLTQQIFDLSGDIELLDKSISQLNSDSNLTTKSISELTSQIEELDETQEEFESLLKSGDKLEEQKDKIEIELDKAKKMVYKLESEFTVKSSELENNSRLMDELTQKIDTLRNSKNPYETMVENYQNEIADLIKDIEGDEAESLIVSKEKDDLKFWEQAFSNSGIKSYILDDITPFLNRRLNKYLNKLTSGQIEAVFSTTSTLKSGEQREKFSLSIVNNKGGEDYVANSSGEKKRIDLAINLALQDLIASRSTKKLNIAMFDEVFDSLDENGVDGVVSLLQELAQEKSTILVVSHNEYLKSFFTNTLTVVKKDGFSTIKGKN